MGLMALAICLVFAKFLFDLYRGESETLLPNLANDSITHAWPFLNHAKASLLAGELPLWNPFTSLGTPFLAEIGLGIFFPLAWLIFFFEVPTALLLIQLVSVLIGLAGFHLYMRELCVNPAARAMGLFLFAFAVFTESFYPTMGYSYCMLPWVLWSSHRFIAAPDIARTCALTVTVGLCFLGGFPNYFIYTLLIVGVYSACLLGFSIPEVKLVGLGKRLWMALIACGLTAGLVAIQLLPAVELSGQTYRDVTSTAAYDASSFWENMSMGLLFSNFVTTDLGFLFGNERLPIKAGIFYLGGTLLFAPLAFLLKRFRKIALALTLSLLFICLFVMSYQVEALSLLQQLPFASAIRINGRSAGYIQFILILLATLGLSGLFELVKERLDILGKILLLGVLVFAIWLGATAFSANESLWFLVGIAGCSLLAFILVAAGVRKVSVGTAAWVLLLIVLTDIGFHRENRFLVPAFVNDDSAIIAPAFDIAAQNDSYHRLVFLESEFLKSGWLANAGPKYQIPSIDAYMGLTLARWENYVRSMLGPKQFDRHVQRSLLQRFYGYFSKGLLQSVLQKPDILARASLRYVITEKNVIEIPSALPRAYLVAHYVTTASEEESLEAIKRSNHALGASVVLEGVQPTFPPRPAGTQAGSAQIESYTGSEVLVKVNSQGPSMLILTDAFYPGWIAMIDGREATIARANSLFRAVEVPHGEHEITFMYKPRSLYWGLTGTLSSLLALAVLWWMARKKTSKDRNVQPS